MITLCILSTVLMLGVGYKVRREAIRRGTKAQQDLGQFGYPCPGCQKPRMLQLDDVRWCQDCGFTTSACCDQATKW